MIGTDFLECGADPFLRLRSSAGFRKSQKPMDSQGQRGINLQTLGHVADPQIGASSDLAFGWLDQAEHDLNHRRLAGTIGADKGQGLALPDFSIDAAQGGVAAESYADVPRFNQNAGIGIEGSGHRGRLLVVRAAAGRTQPGQFDGPALDLETGPACGIGDRSIQVRIADFRRTATGPADQELPGVVGCRLVASDEGVEALDTMDQTVFEQELQGPVDGRRCGASAFALQHVENVVGAHRLVAAPYQFQYPLTQLRQSDATPGTDFPRLQDRDLDALVMVMRYFRKRWRELDRSCH